MTTLSPRERRQARTRQEILATALALINEKGPDKFSLRELARRVDYSPAGLYEYFDGKEAIIEAVCKEGDHRLARYMRAVSSSLPLGDYLVELGLAYIEFARGNPEHFTLMFTQLSEGPVVPYHALEFGATYHILLNAIQRAIDAGQIVVRENYGRDDIAYGLWGHVHGLAMLQLTTLSRLDYDFAAADRASLATFVRGLLGESGG